MANITVSTNVTVVQTLATGDNLYIAAGASVITAGSTVLMPSSVTNDTAVAVDGTLVGFSASAVINLTGTTTGTTNGIGSHLVMIGTTGVVRSMVAGLGINTSGSSNIVFNAGLIDTRASGVNNAGDLYIFENTGTILSRINGVSVFGAGAQITNSGRIVSDDDRAISVSGDSANIKNNGLLKGNFGIISIGNNQIVTNSGEILANLGVFASGVDTIITNAAGGSIVATGAAIETSGSGTQRITNAGDLTGGPAAVIAATSGADPLLNISNSGSIRGGEIGMAITAVAAVITNSGLIEAGLGSAISLLSLGGALTLQNTGTIRAGSTLAGPAVAVLGNTGVETIDNAGMITGRLSLSDGADRVTNTGIIRGAVDMGAGADAFDGRLSDQGDVVLGGAGNDVLRGGAFDDGLFGGADNDQTFGGAGDDELIDIAGAATIFGGAGDDVIGVFGNDAGSLFGGAGDDSIDGSVAADTLIGGAGDDTLIGGGGNDVYGVTTLADVVTELAAGGAGDEVASGAISLDLTLFANVERAALTGVAALNLTGSVGANALTGNMAANRISGGAGSDTILGAGGSDLITGGTARDVMTGGAGADVFVLLSAAETGLATTTRDVISDFAVGTDDMQMIFMNSFIGGAGFTAAGQVRYNAVTGVLAGNTDADALSEWTMQMTAGLALTSGEFVF